MFAIGGFKKTAHGSSLRKYVLDFYRIINDNWNNKLNKNGKLFLEIGDEQGKDILQILSNFNNISVFKDLYGNDRMVVADKK